MTIGGNLSVSAGPIGAGGEAAVAGDYKDKKVAPMFSYTKSKGLFAGVSIEGTGVVELTRTNTGFYGHPVKAEQLLRGDIAPPADAQVLYDMIHKAESRDRY